MDSRKEMYIMEFGKDFFGDAEEVETFGDPYGSPESEGDDE